MWLSGLYQNPVGTHLSEEEMQELGMDGHISEHEPFLQKIVDRPLDKSSLDQATILE